jgi:hypothetical protein
MRTPAHLQKPNQPRGAIGRPPKPARAPPTNRIVFLFSSASIWGWPSRGGLIVLEHATALDVSFLGFDPVLPPLSRDRNQDAEDKLCQRLLMLGAKWFDSADRYRFIAGVAEENEPEVMALEAGEAETPTMMERRWVSVGYPSASDADGGLWVAEFETTMYGMQEKENLIPSEVAQVQLARTMDEKCEILKSLGAKYFKCLELYEGAACLKAWQEKTQGEFGPLEQTGYEDE